MPTVAASSSGRATGATTLSVSHTVPAGTNRYLLVLIDASSAATVTATYGGVALTVLGEVAGGFHLYAFGLANPTVGTANVVFSGSPAGTLAASVLTLTDCTYISPFTGATTGTSTAPSVTVSSAVGALVLDLCAHAVASGTFTVGAGQTSILEQDGLTGVAGRIAVSSEPGAASVTMSWTITSGGWAIAALSAYAVAPSPPSRVTQSVIEILGGTAPPPQPPVRVTQSVIELLSQEAAHPVRVTWMGLEILHAAPAAGTVTQIAVEVFHPLLTPIRASQLALEVFTPRTSPTRATQQAIEHIRAIAAALAVTQQAVELFLYVPPCTAGTMPIDDDEFR